jgi:hypothetical protein
VATAAVVICNRDARGTGHGNARRKTHRCGLTREFQCGVSGARFSCVLRTGKDCPTCGQAEHGGELRKRNLLRDMLMFENAALNVWTGMYEIYERYYGARERSFGDCAALRLDEIVVDLPVAPSWCIETIWP